MTVLVARGRHPPRSLLVGAGLALAVVLGCGGGARPGPATPADAASDRPEDAAARPAAPARRVREVEIEAGGEPAIDTDDLLDGLATRGPRRRYLLWREYAHLDPLELERDRARIESYYRERGYFDARVEDVQVDEFEPDWAEVTFAVREGAPAKLASVTVAGVPADAPAQAQEPALRARMELPVGEPLRYQRYQAAKLVLAQALVQAGYAHAEVRGRIAVDRRAAQAAVRFDLDPGPRVRFGQVGVEGLERIPASTILSRVAWSPGQIFDPRLVAATRLRLQGLRRFQSVRIEMAERTRAPVADIRISVTEGPRREVRLGVGAGFDSASWEVRGRAGYRVHGVPDPLSTVEATVRPAFAVLRTGTGSDTDRQGFVGEASLSLVREDLFLPLLRGTARLSYTVDNYEAYTSFGPRAGVSLARSWARYHLHLGLGWQAALLGFFNVSDALDDATRIRLGVQPEDAGRQLVGGYRVAAFEQLVAYDRRDDPLDTRTGVYADVRLRAAGGFSGSEVSFVTLIPELRGYLSLGERLTLAARARHGRLLSGAELPLTERFYSGGASSQRGFPQRRLTPENSIVADGGTVSAGIGGDALIELSAEARVRVVRLAGQWLGLVGFADGGDVTDDVADLDLADPTNLHWAAGLGLRYITPVGPLRLDVGYRLNRYGVGEPWSGNRLAFHFSIGEAF
ncbi:BamA/OMP85 family outer membrane protein [Haliangium sp.]|uniref:BamA/OMP85 family outer membrane protein n=1 Tax=Haliangium sp. TaxID=2663208 RepID=UPI003D0B644A